MANYQFSADLVNDILDRAGEKTDGTSDFDSTALRFLNRAYQALWSGGNEFVPKENPSWWWLKAESSFILLPSFPTGTVSVTENSASITFSDAPVEDLTNYFFKTDENPDVFQISTHSAGNTAATLDTVYTGDTDTGAAFKSYKTDYTLASDVMVVIAPMKAYKNRNPNVNLADLDEMDDTYPMRDTNAGAPRMFAPVSETVIRFSHYGSNEGKFMRVDYDYLQRPADLTDSGSEEPVVSRRYRYILADMALALMWQVKNDTRATEAAQAARRGIQAMTAENRTRWAKAGRIGLISPRQRFRRQRHIHPLRTATGLIIG